MSSTHSRIDEVAELVKEFRLSEVDWESGDVRVVLRKQSAVAIAAPQSTLIASESVAGEVEEFEEVAEEPIAPRGTPISSPMTGIYYIASSPSAPPFVKEGDQVSAGDVVGLIEAMKVFNEITSTVSGTVLKIAVTSGQVVHPGDPLLYIG